MTLSYSSIDPNRPSRRKLNTAGVVLAVIAAVSLASTVVSAFRLGLPSGFSGVIYAGFLGFLAYGILSPKRWTRPAVVGLATDALLSAIAMIPSFVWMMLLITSGPTGLASWFALIFVAIYVLVIALTVLVPWRYLKLFREPSTREVIAAYDPDTSWVDRHPLPPAALLVVAGVKLVEFGYSTLAGLLSSISSFSLASLLRCAGLAIGVALLTLICKNIWRMKYAKGYQLACAFVILSFLAALVSSVYQIPAAYTAAGRSPQTALQLIASVTSAVLRVALTMFVLIRIKPFFRDDPDVVTGFDVLPADPSPAPRPVLPLD